MGSSKVRVHIFANTLKMDNTKVSDRLDPMADRIVFERELAFSRRVEKGGIT